METRVRRTLLEVVAGAEESGAPPASPNQRREMVPYAFGPYVFDQADLTLTCHGQLVALRPKTAQVLAMLLARAQRILSKEDMLGELWADADVYDANVTQQIFLLRKLFGHYTPEQTYVVTEPRRGYRFVANVSEVQTVRPQLTEAWNLVVRGRFFTDQRRKRPLAEALRAFDAAIALDPECAAAYAGLAECQALSAEYLFAAPRPAFEAARKAAVRALSLDPSLAEPHASLGEVAFYYDGDRAAAQSHYDRAVHLAPASIAIRIDRAWFFAATRQPDPANAELDVALRVEPYSLKILTMQAAVRIFARDYEFVERRCRDVLAMDPAYVQATYYLASALAASGRAASALEVLELRPEAEYEQQFLATYGFAAARAGLRDVAEEALRRLHEMAGASYVSQVNLAQILVGLGRLDDARHALERAREDRDPWTAFVPANPLFDEIR